MKNLIVVFLILVGHYLTAQQLPYFQQKLTDGFMFNPAYTGVSGGALSFNHKRLWAGISESPEINYLSVHSNLWIPNIGVGGSFYSEKLNLIGNTRASLSTSYTIGLNESFQLSFGIGTEVWQTNIDQGRVFARDPDDPLLLLDRKVASDISAGFLLVHSLFDVGVSYARLASGWSSNENPLLNSFISATMNGYLPVRFGYDILEPRILYQANKLGADLLQSSVFYTYDNKYMLGLTYRTNAVGGLSLGLRLENRYFISYTSERRLDSSGSDLGTGHEITLRYDFNRQFFRRVNPSEKEPLRSNTVKKKGN
ncbi:MAG: PorP/SprF family type IX secretion system membrane protein [Cyclobacteriaceae bacterium]